VVRSSHAWTYEPATQTARVTTRWEELGAHGQVLQTWERQPLALHCVFRFEMEHLLKRAGYQKLGVYGDFTWGELTSHSPEMVWVAQAP
jgi:hypothetical protein